jgi:hypothetical protein
MRLFELFCVVALISTGGLTQGYGQATFSFDNYLNIDAPIFDASGNRLFGTNYLAALYGGPTPDSLKPAHVDPGLGGGPVTAQVTFRVAGLAGYFQGGWAGVGNVFSGPGGADAWLQVRAWDTRLGATYEDVVALGQGGHGASSIFRAHGGSDAGGPPTPAGFLYGLDSFHLVPTPIPEPSSALLLLLGLACLFRRLLRS